MTTFAIDKEYDPVSWGSHLPALLACVSSTIGPVLEIGIGHFSTPALHAVCGASQRKLVSVEEDSDWFEQFNKRYSNRYHEFVTGPYDLALERFLAQEWAVVFIDHSPGGERRAKDFKRFLPISQYIVVHDYHRENAEAINPMLTGAKTHITYDYEPPTLVASVVRPIPDGIL